MKISSLNFLILLFPSRIIAQESVVKPLPKRNTVYLEAFGQGIFNSVSFDRLYSIDKKVKTSVSVGVTTIPTHSLFVIGIPVSYNFIFGQKNHHLELGAGLTAMYAKQTTLLIRNEPGTKYTETDLCSYFTPRLGYRFQKSDGGLFFRATFNPAFAIVNKHTTTTFGHQTKTELFKNIPFYELPVAAAGGLSIGYSF